MAGSHVYLLLLALSGLTCVLCEWKAPKFCNGLECPRYTVVKSTKDYEVRSYEASNWVTTMEEGIDFSMVRGLMFRKLFAYITGTNEGNRKVDMTAPVLAKIVPGPGPACPSNFTMGFYIAPQITSPPTPSDTTVKVLTLPAQTVYVRSFPGYARIEQYLEAVVELEKALPTGTKFDKTHFYRAGYDSPFKPFDRHNEVWLTAL